MFLLKKSSKKIVKNFAIQPIEIESKNIELKSSFSNKNERLSRNSKFLQKLSISVIIEQFRE